MRAKSGVGPKWCGPKVVWAKSGLGQKSTGPKVDGPKVVVVRFAVMSSNDDTRQGMIDDGMEVFDMTRDDSHGEDTPQAGPAVVPSTMVAALGPFEDRLHLFHSGQWSGLWASSMSNEAEAHQISSRRRRRVQCDEERRADRARSLVWMGVFRRKRSVGSVTCGTWKHGNVGQIDRS